MMKIGPITLCKITWNAVKMLFNKDKRQSIANPETLEQACANLAATFELLPKEARESALKSESPSQFASMFHHAGGRNLRNNWDLWNSEGVLHKHFKERFGLFHADDMSGLIFQCTFQLLKGEEPTPDKFAEEYTAYWNAYENGGEVVLHDYVINFDNDKKIQTVEAENPHIENIFCKNCCVKIGERNIKSTADISQIPVFCEKCLEEMKERGDAI